MTLNAVDELERASDEFEEAGRLTHREAAAKAREYWLLKQAAWVTEDGEKLTQDAMSKQLRALNADIKAYIEGSGEPLAVEGLPPLVLQQKSGETVDVKSLAEHSPATFARLLESNGFLPNMEVLKALEKANLIDNVPRMPVALTPSLVFDKRGWRPS
jgi:hypothetical protein